jgi:hypothetical protein
MKHLLALLALVGCGSDDPDIPKGAVAFRSVSAFSSTAPSTQLSFDGDPSIQPGDQLITVVLARSVDDIELTASDGWSLLADELAVMCINPFHVFLLTTQATDSTRFDFTFSTEDTFAAITTAYAGGSTPQLMDFILMGEHRNEPITFDAATLAPGSTVWLGGGGQTTWDTRDAPVDTELLLASDGAAAYNIMVSDGNVPAIELPNDNQFCANVGQLSIEP